MRLVRPGLAFKISQVDGANVRDWRRHGFLDGVGVLKGQWQYDFRDIVVLRLSGTLAKLGIGPTSAVALARKIAFTDLTKNWLLIGPNDVLLYFDDLDDLIAERRRRRYLVAIHVPLGDVVRDVREAMDGGGR